MPVVSGEDSGPPQEFEITVAPRAAAVFSAVARSVNAAEFASTSRMLQFGQIADAMSRSSAISWPQPALTRGGVVPPVWLIFVIVRAGSPNVERYTLRSLWAVGRS